MPAQMPTRRPRGSRSRSSRETSPGVMCSSSGRAIATSSTSSMRPRSRAQLAEPPMPGEIGDPLPQAGGVGAEGRRPAPRPAPAPAARIASIVSAGAAPRRSPRAACRAPRRSSGRARGGGRCRRGRPRSPQSSAPRASAARSRPPGDWSRAARDQRGPAQRRGPRRSRRRAAWRASRRRGRARSSPSRAAAAPARWSSRPCRRSPARAARPLPRPVPAGSRWIAVIGAPERVVGIAATSAPRTAATAFAESITRPPPKATRRLGADLVDDRRGGLGHLPAGTRWVRAAASRRDRPHRRGRAGWRAARTPPSPRSASVPSGSVTGPP